MADKIGWKHPLLSRTLRGQRHVVGKGLRLILVVAKSKKSLRRYHPISAGGRIVNQEIRQPFEQPGSKKPETGLDRGMVNHTLLIAKDGTAAYRRQCRPVVTSTHAEGWS